MEITKTIEEFKRRPGIICSVLQNLDEIYDCQENKNQQNLAYVIIEIPKANHYQRNRKELWP